jgi:TPR repeat protein
MRRFNLFSAFPLVCVAAVLSLSAPASAADAPTLAKEQSAEAQNGLSNVFETTRQAAIRGDAKAQYNLANNYIRGRGVANQVSGIR